MTTTAMITPKRLTVAGEILSLKIVPRNGRKFGEAVVKLKSGRKVKTQMSDAVLKGVMALGKNIPSTIALDKIEGQTPWIVGIRKQA